MNFLNLSCLALVFLLSSPSAHAQAAGGRGGMSVECRSAVGTQTFFLDYLIREDQPKNPLAKEPKSLEDSVKRIHELLQAEGLPKYLIDNHRDFFAAYFHRPSERFGEYSFEPIADPMYMSDQELTREERQRLRKNPRCRYEMKTAFVRVPITDKDTIIQYNEGARQGLLTMGWEQLSWALHHEWLRRFSESSSTVRRLNYLLHSTGLKKDKMCDLLKASHTCDLDDMALKAQREAEAVGLKKLYTYRCTGFCDTSNGCGDPNPQETADGFGTSEVAGVASNNAVRDFELNCELMGRRWYNNRCIGIDRDMYKPAYKPTLFDCLEVKAQ